jgi:MFS family permease
VNQPLEPAGLLSRAFGVCFAANLLQGVAFNLFLHLPGHLHDLGASDLEIGWISGLTAIAAILLRAPLGRAMDRRGRRPIILWGGVVNSIAVLGYLWTDSIGPLLYAVRICCSPPCSPTPPITCPPAPAPRAWRCSVSPECCPSPWRVRWGTG